MLENKAQIALGQYLREQHKNGKMFGFYELKVAKGNTFNFKKIENNQDEGLPIVQESGLYWKFSDEDSRKKVCDCVSIPPLPAYLVIKFKGTYYFIRYEEIVKMKESGRVSISEDEAGELSTKVVSLG